MIVVLAIVASAATAVAQRRSFLFERYEPDVSNPKYDGRFAFARVKYTPGPNGYYYNGLPAWAHGYVPNPNAERAERSLMKIMTEVSLLNAHVDESVVVALDDPVLCRYPVAYMTEPGFWTMTDREAAGLRAYLQKGGFVIFDDFRGDGYFNSGGGWLNFEDNMRRVFPDARFIDLEASHGIFHSFFEIDSFDIVPQAYDRGRPIFRGLFEQNDPKKRMLAIVNYNTDVAQYWEFSATGFRPILESNEAYKVGVNYIIYGMTH